MATYTLEFRKSIVGTILAGGRRRGRRKTDAWGLPAEAIRWAEAVPQFGRTFHSTASWDDVLHAGSQPGVLRVTSRGWNVCYVTVDLDLVRGISGRAA